MFGEFIGKFYYMRKKQLNLLKSELKKIDHWPRNNGTVLKNVLKKF